MTVCLQRKSPRHSHPTQMHSLLANHRGQNRHVPAHHSLRPDMTRTNPTEISADITTDSFQTLSTPLHPYRPPSVREMRLLWNLRPHLCHSPPSPLRPIARQLTLHLPAYQARRTDNTELRSRYPAGPSQGCTRSGRGRPSRQRVITATRKTA